MIPRHIYTFWEPVDSMPAYLRLCMKTWEINAPEFDVTLLDYSNSEPYLKRAGYPLDRFYMLPLPQQKDALMAAVLSEKGGIFMDVDTLILNDFEPILKELQHSDIVLFSNHLAFMATKPGAVILPLWVKEIKEKLQNTEPAKIVAPKWDFIGNSITNSLFEKSPTGSVTRLDKNKYAFTPESIHFFKKGNPSFQYRLYWFRDYKEAKPFYRNQFLIALHNSRTPDWYKKLSEEEVLSENCLLSKTLKNVLNKNHKQIKNKPIPTNQQQKKSISFSLIPAVIIQRIKWAFK